MSTPFTWVLRDLRCVQSTWSDAPPGGWRRLPGHEAPRGGGPGRAGERCLRPWAAARRRPGSRRSAQAASRAPRAGHPDRGRVLRREEEAARDLVPQAERRHDLDDAVRESRGADPHDEQKCLVPEVAGGPEGEREQDGARDEPSPPELGRASDEATMMSKIPRSSR